MDGGAGAAPTKPSEPRKTASDGTQLREEVGKLVNRAWETRDGHWWDPTDHREWDPDSDDLTTARNAHRTNTVDEMHDALGHDYNWFEGDLRVNDAGVPVMAHDASAEGDGLTLEEWLTVGAAGERAMKIDVKEAAAIPKLLDAIERSGIPDGRIMLNVGAVPDDVVLEMRRRFPDAWLAINPASNESGYTAEGVARATSIADRAGGRVTFPIRWDLASDGLIARLRPHGKVSIWTATTEGTPDHAKRETEKLRERGVEGVIDLGPPLSTKEKAIVFARDVWESEPVRGARSVAESGVELGKDAAGAAVDGAKAVVDVAGEVASHIPVVGGLFD